MSINLQELLDQSFNIGLIYKEEGDLLDESSINIIFIHKTFQEYSAAVYLSHLYETNRSEFESILSKFKKTNDIEYILRFCCGLNIYILQYIFNHILSDRNICPFTKNSWRLPLILVHESQLSHGEYKVANIIVFDKYLTLPRGKSIHLYDAEESAALENFASTYMKSTWLKDVTLLDNFYGFDSVKAMLNVLQHLPSLNTLTIRIDKLKGTSDELDNFKHLCCINIHEVCFFCESTNSYAFSVNLLVGLLVHFTSLKSLRLRDVCLQGTVTSSFPSLSKSLTAVHFLYHEHMESNVNSLLSFMKLLPSLTVITFHGMNLTDKVDQNITSVDTNEIRESCNMYMSSGSASLVSLATFLKSMPQIESMTLKRVFLSGQLDENDCQIKNLRSLLLSGIRHRDSISSALLMLFRCMPSLELISLEDINMSKMSQQDAQCMLRFPNIISSITLLGSYTLCNIDVKWLINLLSYMPALEQIKMQGILLIGELMESSANLSKVLKVFHMSGKFDHCSIYAKLLFNFLQVMPSLEKISIENVHVVGELGEIQHEIPLKELKEFNMFGKLCKIHVLGPFLTLIPSKTKVKLDEVTCVTDSHEACITYSSKNMSKLQISLPNRTSVINSNLVGNLTQILSHKESARVNEVDQSGENSWSSGTLITHVILRHCCITMDNLISLLTCIPELRLVDVDVTDGLGEKIPHSIESVKYLISSSMTCTSAFAKLFKCLSPLEKVELCNFEIPSYPGKMYHFLSTTGIIYTPKLQHLNLAENNIGPDGALAVAQSFKNTPTLQHLCMKRNNIGSGGVSALAKSFQHIPILQHLDLSYNDIGPSGASVLANSFQHTPALQHLDLSYNDIGPIGALALAKSFQHMPALQHLNLESNQIDSIGTSALAKSFQHTQALQHLDLSHNWIGSCGASALAQSFQHTPALQHLYLFQSDIDPYGMLELAQSFRHLPLLQYLNIGWNEDCGPFFLQDILRHLVHLPRLETLDLPHIEITKEIRHYSELTLLMRCLKTLGWNAESLCIGKQMDEEDIKKVCAILRNHKDTET